RLLEAALRPSERRRDQLGDARAEAREQHQRLCGRRRQLLPQHGRPHARHLLQEREQSEVRRRSGLSADGATLLGAKSDGADSENDGAYGEVRTGGCGPETLAVLTATCSAV